MSAIFHHDLHRYEVDGAVLPSVTQVLQLSGITDVSGIPSVNLYRATEIGIAVHTATELLDEDDLDLDSIDSLILGYILAYQKFKEESGFRPTEIEKRGVTAEYGYCIDRLGMIGEDYWLLDLKTASRPSPAWQIQTAAYALTTKGETKRAVVHLAKDGKYKFLKHEDGGDFDVWRAALVLANWRLAHGAKLR